MKNSIVITVTVILLTLLSMEASAHRRYRSCYRPRVVYHRPVQVYTRPIVCYNGPSNCHPAPRYYAGHYGRSQYARRWDVPQRRYYNSHHRHYTNHGAYKYCR